MADESELDGMIYLGDQTPPLPPSMSGGAGDDDTSWDAAVMHKIDDAAAPNGVIYERVLLKTKDPTSLPHVKKTCAKWIRPWSGGKICVGWKLEYRWLYVTATLRVSTGEPVDIGAEVEACLKQGAIAMAIAAILTGGSGAPAAAAAAIKSCLAAKLGANLLSVSVDLSHHRGGWE
ncbi:hypothetical protein IWC96_15255 [Brevundimonas sp. BAL450]|jgi:hypothetical protein|uniref:hypothetical protein n=1 Tax=Brevundimonas TaxID=41275 RepID=UPI0018CBD83C|nr:MULTISPECIES: hypothetical protein [Brevundimonas]MBG7616632.1 hypothetical protein [Brevundimonas sp. BAL450]